ncbi:MAG: undecaprenyl-diphosphate phosphatase [Pseudomonadota bacterium]
MDFLQVFILAIVQGFTEFLPISSSAHLILVPRFLGWQDQGIAFDVAVHIGTLSAVLWYFKDELITLYKDWQSSVVQQKMVGDSLLAWGVLLGTLPVGLAGLLVSDYMANLRTPLIIAITTIVFGLVLWYADKKGDRKKSEHQLTLLHIMAIGVAQAIALIPGTSRSGITISMALLLGYSRTGAARFSFLLSIPVIVLAGGLETIKLIKSDEIIDWFALFSGTLLSAISAYICIVYFIKLLDKIGMQPFVIYRLVLGLVLLFVFVI